MPRPKLILVPIDRADIADRFRSMTGTEGIELALTLLASGRIKKGPGPVRASELLKIWPFRLERSETVGRVTLHGCRPAIETMRSLPPDLPLTQISASDGRLLGIYWLREDSREALGFVVIERRSEA